MSWLCMLCVAMGILLFVGGGGWVVSRLVRMAGDPKPDPEPTARLRPTRAVALNDYRADIERWERMASEGGFRLIVLDEAGRTVLTIDGTELDDVPTPKQRGRR